MQRRSFLGLRSGLLDWYNKLASFTPPYHPSPISPLSPSLSPYDPLPLSITNSQSIKITMEKTDQSLKHNRPNILPVILEKGERNVPSLLLCAFDRRVVVKEQEKTEKYREYKRVVVPHPFL